MESGEHSGTTKGERVRGLVVPPLLLLVLAVGVAVAVTMGVGLTGGVEVCDGDTPR